MRFYIIILWIILFNTTVLYAQCDWVNMVYTDDIECQDGTLNWILTFEEKFNQNELDQTKWRVPYQGVLRDFIFEDEKQWYANTGGIPSIPFENNVVVNNGTLKLITREEQTLGTYIDWNLTGDGPYIYNSSTFDYSSGQVESVYKFGYGTYEARCKIPKGKGFWPAFWLYNGTNGAEIDIFEFWNEEHDGSYDPSRLSSIVNTNILYDNPGDGINGKSMCMLKVGHGIDYSIDFHVFTFEWDRFKMRWYIDGELKREKYSFYTLPNSQPIDCNSFDPWVLVQKISAYPDPENYNVLFNTAVSRGDKLPPDDATPFPSSFEIDYFRYWKKEDCIGDLIAYNIADLNLSSELYNIKIKENIYIESGVILDANQQLDLKASNSITIDPGAQLNGVFEAWIAPCSQYKSMITQTDDLFNKPNPLNKKETQLSELETINKETNEIKISPNPFLSNINLELSNEKDMYIKVCTSTGIVINEFTFNNQKIIDINLSHLPSGVYFLKCFDENNFSEKTYKIIKN